jgi:hypothetical protein
LTAIPLAEGGARSRAKAERVAVTYSINVVARAVALVFSGIRISSLLSPVTVDVLCKRVDGIKAAKNGGRLLVLLFILHPDASENVVITQLEYVKLRRQILCQRLIG